VWVRVLVMSTPTLGKQKVNTMKVLSINKHPTEEYKRGDIVELRPLRYVTPSKYYIIASRGAKYMYINIETGGNRGGSNHESVESLVAEDTPLRKLMSIELGA